MNNVTPLNKNSANNLVGDFQKQNIKFDIDPNIVYKHQSLIQNREQISNIKSHIVQILCCADLWVGFQEIASKYQKTNGKQIFVKNI